MLASCLLIGLEAGSRYRSMNRSSASCSEDTIGKVYNTMVRGVAPGSAAFQRGTSQSLLEMVHQFCTLILYFCESN